MSFKEKNTAVSLGTTSLVLSYFLFRVFQMLENGAFEAGNLFRLWGIVIGLIIGITIFATILTHMISGVVMGFQNRDEQPEIEAVEDERDMQIDFQGTKMSHRASGIGVTIAMLTFVLGYPPLVMFSLLIFFAIFAQILGDITRLALYRRN